MLMMAAALAAAPVTDRWRGWGRFSRAPALARKSETVEVATEGVEPGTHRLHFVMRLTRHLSNDAIAIAWADSATCPAVAATVAAMRTLSVPAIAPPGETDLPPVASRAGGDHVVVGVLDGTTYTFEGPARGSDGHVAFSTNTDTPLARWVDARLAALGPCWKPVKS